jgi:hypothetical protein
MRAEPFEVSGTACTGFNTHGHIGREIYPRPYKP